MKDARTILEECALVKPEMMVITVTDTTLVEIAGE